MISRKHKGIYIVLFFALLVIVSTFYKGFEKNRLIFNQSYLEISGRYGEKIPWDSIESVSLTNKEPSFRNKVKGFSFGSKKKGIFSTSQGVRFKAILNSSSKPWILIIKKSGEVIYYSSERSTSKSSVDKINNFIK